MEKLTDFEWYNDLGMTLSFKDNPCIGRRFSFPEEFYYNSEINRLRPIGIRWIFEGRVIDIPNVRKNGSCPVPTMDRVIVSYKNNHINYSCIYNADGSLYMNLVLPQRTDFNIQERALRAPNSPSFIADIVWVDNPKDKKTLWVELRGLADPYWELFRLDPVTGEFGESEDHGCF
ncbi:MAG: hypothetical protein MJY63_01945 [Paludibacteraceae bacterium]|nr:hypothetical protein [Paludibacteraceae bacterium]